MLRAIALLAALAATASAVDSTCLDDYLNAGGNAARIVGGTAVDVARKYPFVAHLLIDGMYQCGGVLIHPRVVLTAAHCVQMNSEVRVTIGEHDLSQRENCEQRITGYAYPHPNYDGNTDDNDIALILLNRRTIYPVVASPVTTHVPEGAVLRAIGWGALSEGGAGPAVINEVDLSVLSPRACRRAYNEGDITRNMFCASAPGKDTCQGDSGGPLFFDSDPSNPMNPDRFQIVGLTSWGTGCARPRVPGVYTRLANYARWIKSTRRGLLNGSIVVGPAPARALESESKTEAESA